MKINCLLRIIYVEIFPYFSHSSNLSGVWASVRDYEGVVRQLKRKYKMQYDLQRKGSVVYFFQRKRRNGIDEGCLNGQPIKKSLKLSIGYGFSLEQIKAKYAANTKKVNGNRKTNKNLAVTFGAIGNHLR